MNQRFCNPFQFTKEKSNQQLSSNMLSFLISSSSNTQITPIQPNKTSNLFLNQMTTSTCETSYFTSSIKPDVLQEITPKLLSKSLCEYLIDLQRNEIVADIFPLSSDQKYKSKKTISQRLSYHSAYSTAGKNIKNNYDNINQFDKTNDHLKYHKKIKSQSAKKPFASQIRFTLNENKSKHNQIKIFQIFRDNDLGIDSKWQQYQITNVIILSFNYFIRNTTKMLQVMMNKLNLLSKYVMIN